MYSTLHDFFFDQTSIPEKWLKLQGEKMNRESRRRHNEYFFPSCPCPVCVYICISLWATAKLNPQISPRRVLDILYPIFCFQQAFWLNIRHSMSPLKNIYIFRRIFLRQKLKNRAKIEKSVKIKNWQMNFFGFFFSFFHQNDKEWPPWLPKWWKLIFVSL